MQQSSQDITPKTTYLKDYQAPSFLIEKVDLEFYLDEEETLVKSLLTFTRNVSDQNDLQLVGDQLELVSVTLNGAKLTNEQYQATSSSLTIFNVPDHFTLAIQTRIKPQNNTALSGLYKSNGNFCTQCESHGFRRITYFLDRPDVMSRYTVTIFANEERYPVLLSNGNLISSGKTENGKHWAKWQDPFKKPSYLFALVAGDLSFIEDTFTTKSGRKVLLRIYVEKENHDKCNHAMQAIKKAMRWDEENYGREYDLDIYMVVAVSDFNMGAMENKGLNIFNTQYILARPDTATDIDYIHIESVIAHEYFHNWTGNRITCRDWFQLSLKEGLTIFRDQSFTEDTTSKTVSRIIEVDYLRAAQFPEDAGPLAHPVQPDSYIEINNFYTSTVYNKGSEVIRMLRTIIGNEAFRKGMDLYFTRYDGQAVTIQDFVKAHEDASGIDLSQFRLWYAQAGTPLLEITDNYDKKEQKYTLKIKQSCPNTPGQTHKKPFHIPIKMGLLNSDGSEILSETLQLKNQQQEWIFENIKAKPVPSLLRNFSAPVKIEYQYSNQDLSLLITHDTDFFNRWEAGYKYALNVILNLVNSLQNKKSPEISSDYLKIFEFQLENLKGDNWLLSRMLMLPSERYIAEQMKVIDVDSIHEAREFVLRAIAKKLKNEFISKYQENHHHSPFQFNIDEAGKRFLKNLCLSYLIMLDDTKEGISLAMQQFKQALKSNMTDTIGALHALNQVACPEREEALDQFYQTWQHDALVIDKWLALQASSKLPDTLVNVKHLVSHQAFDLKNPNKVYALIGGFSGNAVRFHEKNGEGYQFLTKIILQLDAINPQIASRMVKPLTNWRRFDEGRQSLMRKELELIAKREKISKDVFELVNKSL